MRQRFEERRASILADLDAARLTGVDRALIDMAVRLLLRAERTRDITEATRATALAARLLSRVSGHAKPSTGPSLQDYLAENYGDEEGTGK